MSVVETVSDERGIVPVGSRTLGIPLLGGEIVDSPDRSHVSSFDLGGLLDLTDFESLVHTSTVATSSLRVKPDQGL